MINDNKFEVLSNWIDENVSPRIRYNTRHHSGVLKGMYEKNRGNTNPSVTLEEFNRMMQIKGYKYCTNRESHEGNRRYKISIYKPRY